MEVVDTWTGSRANALLRAMRETNEGFAGRLGIAVRTVANWNAKPGLKLTTEMQRALDTLLYQAPPEVKTRFSMILSQTEPVSVPAPRTAPDIAVQDLVNASEWVTSTNTNPQALEELNWATVSLAEAHTQAPAKKILPEVLRLHRKIEKILNGGTQRLKQRRELIRIDSELLAHACLLLGDLNQDKIAEEVGSTALLFAREAESSEANAWYARAKTARWQDKYVEAADLARRGFEHSPDGPMKLQLAWYEANAAALLGDTSRGRQAVKRAERAAENSLKPGSSHSAWSFPIERQALFAMSFATKTGDPDAALRAVEVADTAWASGNPEFPALWAQFRVGAGIALLMNNELDGAAEQVDQMLNLPAELRMSTVTRYLEDFEPLLQKPKFQGNKVAAELSQRIQDFNTAALSEDRNLENE